MSPLELVGDSDRIVKELRASRPAASAALRERVAALGPEPAPFPPGERPDPADLLSDELDRFSRDRVYEEAVRSA